MRIAALDAAGEARRDLVAAMCAGQADPGTADVRARAEAYVAARNRGHYDGPGLNAALVDMYCAGATARAPQGPA